MESLCSTELFLPADYDGKGLNTFPWSWLFPSMLLLLFLVINGDEMEGMVDF